MSDKNGDRTHPASCRPIFSSVNKQVKCESVHRPDRLVLAAPAKQTSNENPISKKWAWIPIHDMQSSTIGSLSRRRPILLLANASCKNRALVCNLFYFETATTQTFDSVSQRALKKR